MKQRMIAFTMAALAFGACNSGTTGDNKTAGADTIAAPAAAAAPEKKAWVAVDSATEMKAWMEYSTPGEAHKMLAKSDGSWAGQTTMWMSKDGPPATSTSSMINKMVMGGRYQHSSFSGSFMGMPFEGMSITAYDNYKKKYISTWIDNMGTGIMKMEGNWDDAAKALVLTGTCTNPANGVEYEMKEVYKMIDDNNEVMEMYGPDSKTGEVYKTMEIKLTRKK